MATRIAARDGVDDFPTPPWATRAFLHYVFGGALGRIASEHDVAEPAANRRFMSKVLAESFRRVHESDVKDYGAGVPVFDFLQLERDRAGAQFAFTAPPAHLVDGGVDWIITNPPFKDLNLWLPICDRVARKGFALTARLQAIETEGRFDLYRQWQGALGRGHVLFAQYVERVAMVEGRCDPDANSATAYCWIVVDKERRFASPFSVQALDWAPVIWIPPCRDRFERRGDYRVQPLERAA